MAKLLKNIKATSKNGYAYERAVFESACVGSYERNGVVRLYLDEDYDIDRGFRCELTAFEAEMLIASLQRSLSAIESNKAAAQALAG